MFECQVKIIRFSSVSEESGCWWSLCVGWSSLGLGFILHETSLIRKGPFIYPTGSLCQLPCRRAPLKNNVIPERFKSTANSLDLRLCICLNRSSLVRCFAFRPDIFRGSTWFAPECRKVKAKVGILYSKSTIILVKEGKGTISCQRVCMTFSGGKMMFYRADQDTSTPGYDFDFRTLRWIFTMAWKSRTSESQKHFL